VRKSHLRFFVDAFCWQAAGRQAGRQATRTNECKINLAVSLTMFNDNERDYFLTDLVLRHRIDLIG
jgi:hypothetical protein